MSDTSNDGPHGKRFLVVEDEFLILLDIQHILESAGAAHVATAGRLSEAERILARESFDAVLLDLKLDKETSLEFAKQLAARKIPFLFMTGAPAEAKQAQDFGDDVLVVGKPFDSATLLAALSKALAGRT
jgi:CheY-like chemotaxis protein